jgi:hypothetical protein
LAHRKSDGQPCREHPIDGLDVCYHHGGATKNARAAATERVARAEIVQVARTLGLARDGVSEAQAMREELSRTLAHIEWLEVVVTDLGAEEVFWARTMEETGRESGSVTGQSEGGTTRDHAKVRREARLNVAVQYLMTERKHLVVVAGKMIELGITRARSSPRRTAGSPLGIGDARRARRPGARAQPRAARESAGDR